MKLNGAHAFGAWKPNPADRRGPPWVDRWFWISKYPQRRPTIGCYNLGIQADVDAVAAQCVAGGVDFLNLCTYFNPDTGLLEEDQLLRGLKASQAPTPRHCLGLETLGSFKGGITCLDDWKKLCELMAIEFQHPGYLEVDGRPVVTMIKMDHFAETCAPKTGLSVRDLLAMARTRTGRDVYFVACGEATSFWLAQAVPQGYSAFSAYNWMRGWSDRDKPTAKPGPKGFAALDALYRDEWAHLLSKLPQLGLDLWVPTITGFDASPVGEGVIGDSTLVELDAHWRAALAVLNASDRCRATVCDALDEHFEGSVMLGDDVLGRARMGLHRRIYKGLP